MTVIPGLYLPLKAVGKHVQGCDESGDRQRVEVSGAIRRAACPSCLRRSSQVHGRYQRQLGDLPSFGLRATLSVNVRRFKCVNPNCARRTFSEPLDPLAAPSQRRTQRLSEALRSLGYALGGSAAARLAARLGMTVSGDTVLRELRRAGCPALAAPPVVVGIDDWAIKRGHRYGTLIVDLEARQPIEVLGRRETTIVADWLRQHPTVEIVARDRAGAYSDAVRTASQGAQQVADRWHLLTNLRECVERLLVRRSASVREAARLLGEALRIESQPITGNSGAAPLPLNAWQRLGVHRRAARLARYEEVVRRNNLGESFKRIARAMNLDHRTVRKFARAGAFPERVPRTSGATLLDGHRHTILLHASLRAASTQLRSGTNCRPEASLAVLARSVAQWRGLTQPLPRKAKLLARAPASPVHRRAGPTLGWWVGPRKERPSARAPNKSA
jgi:DNA-binding NarL/FixJ family response regulator